jgi:hypothetical protein
LSQRQQAGNTTRSRVRARVEHVFADQQNAMSGKFASSCAPSGWREPCVKVGMMNLVYNMRRLGLKRAAVAPA